VLRARLATAAVAIPILIWLVCASPLWIFAGFIVAITAVGLGEFASMALAERPAAQLLSIIAGLSFAGVVVLHRVDALGLVLVASLVGGLVLSLFDPDMSGAITRLGNGLIAALYVGFLLPHVVSLRQLPNGGERWVFFALACAMGTDTGGYFAGRIFGRTKLFPRVSPKKTVEGAFGALLGSVLLGFFALWVFPPVGLSPQRTVWLALAIAVLAQTGDLLESMLKRAYGAKDSGWIFPGHGGVLDRIDSLVLPFVFTYYLNAGGGIG
jgi:phosphatidate cytidylyltransferase